MEKIKMTTPLVEMDGDEMTRILWKMIKDELLLPFVDLKTEYYDLGLKYRNETNDQVTFDSAEATKKYGVAVKCATITPNAARMPEYNLKEMWKSPNGTIRAILDGTVFRAPIIVKGIEPYVKNWTKPITIARHAYGDVYKGVEMKIPAAGKAELVYTNEAGEETRELIHNFETPGIIQGMHNINESIESFARSCFNFALDTKQDLWFATKDTISKKYDHTFKDIFNDIFDSESECQEKSNDSQALSNIDLDEISEFVDNISEILEEFVDEAFENEEEGLYEYNGSIECEADDYNDSGYYIKAKAKAACKEELSRAVSEVKGLYENVKKELIDTTEICYKELTFSIAAFLKNVFFESCEAFADVYCTGNTKGYVERKIDDLKTSINKPDESWEEQIQKKCQKAFAEAIEKSFDEEEKEVPGIKELFEKCEYCEEYEDDYSFYIDSACESLVDAYESIIYDAEADFPNAVYESYVEVMNEYVNNLEEWIGSFQNRKTVTGREMIERIIKRLNM